jgi:hypothetical protein
MSLASPASGQVVTGVLGFLVVAAMGVALFFLLRSLNKQLRKVVPPPSWREQAGQAPPPGGQAEPGEPEPAEPAGPGENKHFQQNGTRLT